MPEPVTLIIGAVSGVASELGSGVTSVCVFSSICLGSLSLLGVRAMQSVYARK